MQTVVWHLDNLASIGGLPVTVTGAPRVVDTEYGKAVAFDGAADGLFLEVNPIAGWSAFTIEVLFRQDAGGAPEQRFLHIQANDNEDRVLIETRVPGSDAWYADTYIRSGEQEMPLNDPALTHPTGVWHTVALVYDGQAMTQYVNGVRELAAAIPAPPMGSGRTALGVRLNKVFWFKGLIREVRITPRALAPGELAKP